MIRLQGFYTSKYIFDKVFSSFRKKEKQQKKTLLMLFLGWSTSSLFAVLSGTASNAICYFYPQVALVVRKLPENAGDMRREFHPWVGKTWRRERKPTPVFLPGESHGQKSLASYSP